MVWLIAKREFRARTLSKANIISISIMAVIFIAGALIAKPFITGSDDGDPETLHVDSATTALVPHLESAAEQMGMEVTVEEVTVTGEPEVPDGVAAAITGPVEQPEVYLESGDTTIIALVTSAVEAAVLEAQVEALGGDSAQVAAALEQAEPVIIMVGEGSDFDPGAFFSGMAVLLVLFFVLVQSASVIMMGVVEEKSSRVVEILLATVKPGTLLGGKVLGVGMYSLVQALGMVLPLTFAAWHLEFLDSLEIGIGALLVNLGVWFLLGFAIYTILFGGLASLVSRQEDIGAVSTPMIILMMVPLYLGIYLVPSSPSGTVTQVLTQVPFFAPFMVPMRAAFGEITMAETLLAVGICLVTLPLLVWIAGRVYRGAVLATGGRMKLSDALSR